jgi:hypothetical protein
MDTWPFTGHKDKTRRMADNRLLVKRHHHLSITQEDSAARVLWFRRLVQQYSSSRARGRRSVNFCYSAQLYIK